MKVRPQHILFAALIVLVVVMISFAAERDQPGTVIREEGSITKFISNADADATATFDIVLKAGTEPEREADSMFALLELEAIRKLTFDTRALTLTVGYDSGLIREQRIRQQLAQAGYVARSIEEAVPAELASDGSVQSISLATGDSLEPSFVRAKAGVPLILTFSEGFGHLATVSIPALGIIQDLTADGVTITIENPAPGTYDLVCAEGFVDGTLVVE
ncbi:MAG: cupredoxin domain-containing protein [Coriobacteriia bacterium]